MPYIGGRHPDYTTKLNLMYNLRDAFSAGEVPGGEVTADQNVGWGGWNALRRGWLGTVGEHSLTRAMSAENDAVR